MPVFQREDLSQHPRFRLTGTQNWNSWEAAFKVCKYTFSRGILEKKHFCLLLCIEPWADSLFKTVCYHPTEPVNTSPADAQSQAIKVCVLQVVVTKVRTSDMYVHSSFFIGTSNLGRAEGRVRRWCSPSEVWRRMQSNFNVCLIRRLPLRPKL